RLRERRQPVRRRALGALFARDGQGRVPHGGAKGHRHRDRQTLVAALARGRGPAKRARTLASLSLVWKPARGPRGGEGQIAVKVMVPDGSRPVPIDGEPSKLREG